jgi:membrane associated rhomboid family serine protease
MIPLHDRLPHYFIVGPWFNWVFIAAIALAYFIQEGQSDGIGMVYSYGLIPARLFEEAQLHPALLRVPAEGTLITYAFFHANWVHLLGNLIYLWVFGDNIEDAFGHIRYIVFFLLGAVVAGLMQALYQPSSTLPIIGASGAVAAVLGAYFLLYPRASILTPIVIFPVYLPAFLLIGLWFAFQIYGSISMPDSPVAWWTHIGGFVFGMLGALFLKRRQVPLFGGGRRSVWHR